MVLPTRPPVSLSEIKWTHYPVQWYDLKNLLSFPCDWRNAPIAAVDNMIQQRIRDVPCGLHMHARQRNGRRPICKWIIQPYPLYRSVSLTYHSPHRPAPQTSPQFAHLLARLSRCNTNSFDKVYFGFRCYELYAVGITTACGQRTPTHTEPYRVMQHTTYFQTSAKEPCAV